MLSYEHGERFKMDPWKFRNDTSTLTLNQTVMSNRTRTYVFAPVSFSIRLSLFISMLSFGVFGFIANSLILYLKQKQTREKKRRQPQRPFRRPLTEYFIISLVVSDLLCSLVSLPLSASEMFFDVFQSNWVCKVFRFFNILFPVVTIFSLLVSGIERYLGIFRPFSVMSREKAKKLVLGTWILGIVVTLLPTATYKRIKYDIGEYSFTLICKYDNSVALYRMHFTIFLLIIYIIPSFVLTFMNIRIMKYHKNHASVGMACSSMACQKAILKRRITRMFVSLIFAFIIPYLLFISYSAIMMILKPKVTLAFDFVARHTSALLGYANGATSAVILFYNDRYLRRKLVQMLRGSECHRSRISAQGQIKERNPQDLEIQGFDQENRSNNVSKENSAKDSNEEETKF